MAEGAGYIQQKAQQRGVTCVELWVTDLGGRARAVSVPLVALEAVLEDGLTVSASVVGGAPDDELVLVPDAHTFAVVGTVGRLLCDVQEVSGAPSPLCVRTVLKRQLGRANGLGYTFYVGATVEHRWLIGREPLPVDGGSASMLGRAATDVLESVQVPVRAFHPARGDASHQAFDLDWVDPLTLADALVTHRRVLREVATTHGRGVTFMPHPWTDAARNRLDLYVSLVEGGTASFSDALDPRGLSPAARTFGAWLEAEVPALELVMKATVNSWTEADTPRVMASASGRGEGGASVLVRGADACANPYLVLALVLGAGLASGRGAPPSVASPAATLVEAARAAAASSLTRDVLGVELLRVLVQRATDESRAWRRQVTAWELVKYLDM